MLDLTESIAPKSDQMNADDLMSGPRTFTISEVRQGASTEQPFDFYLAEFHTDRPFKPSKSMRRVMVSAWGKDGSTYVGKRLTLYRDPAVRFGGQEVGGIRISHMSGIEKPMKLALTATRGKREAYVVQPLADEPPPKPADPAKALFAALQANGLTDKDAALAYIGDVVGREVASSKELTAAEAQQVIDSFGGEK